MTWIRTQAVSLVFCSQAPWNFVRRLQVTQVWLINWIIFMGGIPQWNDRFHDDMQGQIHCSVERPLRPFPSSRDASCAWCCSMSSSLRSLNMRRTLTMEFIPEIRTMAQSMNLRSLQAKTKTQEHLVHEVLFGPFLLMRRQTFADVSPIAYEYRCAHMISFTWIVRTLSLLTGNIEWSINQVVWRRAGIPFWVLHFH